MEDTILFMACDYEAIKYCKLSQNTIQKILDKHFFFSLLLSEKVVFPVGCYYESPYVQRLVEKYYSFFFPFDAHKPLAGLGLGDDRESFLDDVKIKASWFPEEYLASDIQAASELTKNIIDVSPTIRAGKMRKRLIRAINEDIEENGEASQVIYNILQDDSSEIIKPLEIITSEQKYALLPPYIEMVIDKYDFNITAHQKDWLNYILFKNYVISCSQAYSAYCNNPFCIYYDDFLKKIYSYQVDYRDTLLFEQFYRIFPFKGIDPDRPPCIADFYQIKESERFKLYIYCYKRVVEQIKNKLSVYIADLKYSSTFELFNSEFRVSWKEFKDSLTAEDAEILYRIFRKPFIGKKKKFQGFQAWLIGRSPALPLIDILSVFNDVNTGFFAQYIDELSAVTKFMHHKERSNKMSKVQIGVFSKQIMDSENVSVKNADKIEKLFGVSDVKQLDLEKYRKFKNMAIGTEDAELASCLDVIDDIVESGKKDDLSRFNQSVEKFREQVKSHNTQKLLTTFSDIAGIGNFVLALLNLL